MKGARNHTTARQVNNSINHTLRSDIAAPIVLDEVTALIRYASERGADPDGTVLTPLNNALVAYEKAPAQQKSNKREKLLKYYAMLAAKTFPVSGRTLLDTAEATGQLTKLATVTVVLLVLALSNEILAVWFKDHGHPQDGWLLNLLYAQQYVFTHLSPFLWGGLGACVYLLKRLYDLCQDRQFDRAKLHGWSLRVLLGAALAAVVVLLIFNGSATAASAVKLQANAVAFFVGLGVRVVYGAFERTVELLAEKINLAAVDRARTPSIDVRTYLGQKLNETGTRTNHRQRVLGQLLRELDQLQVT